MAGWLGSVVGGKNRSRRRGQLFPLGGRTFWLNAQGRILAHRDDGGIGHFTAAGVAHDRRRAGLAPISRSRRPWGPLRGSRRAASRRVTRNGRLLQVHLMLRRLACSSLRGPTALRAPPLRWARRGRPRWLGGRLRRNRRSRTTPICWQVRRGCACRRRILPRLAFRGLPGIPVPPLVPGALPCQGAAGLPPCGPPRRSPLPFALSFGLGICGAFTAQRRRLLIAFGCPQQTLGLVHQENGSQALGVIAEG